MANDGAGSSSRRSGDSRPIGKAESRNSAPSECQIDEIASPITVVSGNRHEAHAKVPAAYGSRQGLPADLEDEDARAFALDHGFEPAWPVGIEVGHAHDCAAAPSLDIGPLRPIRSRGEPGRGENEQ